MKIVIADDHHVVRKGLRYFFATQEDIEVVGEASTGAEALQQAEKTEPDIILMDLSMPDMDGIEAAKIAAALCISEKTVKTHVSNLLSKLNLSDRTQAALYAVKYNVFGKAVKL
ncbi:response regulator transcription factor [Bacillus velezensis]|uniref:response regulator transcription factor n=1 Tax=Bacillus velezensis TaxID=492670 RepID=UPI00325BA022